MRAGAKERARRREVVALALRHYDRLYRRSKGLPWPEFDVHGEEVRLQMRIEREAAEHQQWLDQRQALRWKKSFQKFRHWQRMNWDAA